MLIVVQSKIQSLLILMMIFPAVLVIVATAVVRYRQGYGPAKHFLIAWTALTALVMVGYLNTAGFFDLSGVAPYVYKIGHTTEMTLLSMALATRMNSTKAAQERAEKVAELAIASSQAKSEFLAKMSHEIRTPMNGVLGMAELLKGTQLKPSQMQFLNTIERSGQSLLSVINDILDYSKLESGKMSVEKRRFDLYAVLDDVYTTFSLRAKERNLDVLLCVKPDLHRWVLGDEVRIQQILINLLGNALKFTTEGHVCLKVGMVANSSSMVSFSVQDTGIGIEPSAISKLFESFAQEDSSVTRKYGGTGLGLSICKQLVELMSGTIGVESEKGLGSNFHFELPLEACEVPTEQSVVEAQLNRAIEDKSVAMVTHSCELASNLAETLQAWGVKLSTHVPAATAKLWPELGAIDLVILHESLSDQERGVLLQSFSTEHQNDNVKLLVRKTVGGEELGEGLLESERIHCLLQPCGRIPFRDALARCLGAAKAVQTKHSIANQGQALRSYAHLRVLIAEDTPVNQLVLQKMLRRFEIDADTVADGKLAVQAVVDANFGYDIIFMDCEMPVMDGLEATQEIRKLEAQGKPRCAIYALTAHALAEHREKALAAGMDAHYTKPVSLASLRHALERFEESKSAA